MLIRHSLMLLVSLFSISVIAQTEENSPVNGVELAGYESASVIVVKGMCTTEIPHWVLWSKTVEADCFVVTISGIVGTDLRTKEAVELDRVYIGVGPNQNDAQSLAATLNAVKSGIPDGLPLIIFPLLYTEKTLPQFVLTGDEMDTEEVTFLMAKIMLQTGVEIDGEILPKDIWRFGSLD